MDVISELWLHSVCKYEPEKVEKVAAIVGGLEDNRFSSGERNIRALKNAGMDGEFAERISDPSFLEDACRMKEYCRENEIRIITMDSDEYPELLKEVKTPPRILFAKGQKLDLNKNLFVSVVGSRKTTDQGKIAARQISADMAKNGIVVVSGMAEGIDAEAHWGALDVKGKTVAVLAGSVDVVYPLSNKKLYFEILENGTVISERPPGTTVKPYFYQQRNRIVVGLSRGTVIVEGKIQSGTAITARLALENNRDVFAVPCNPTVAQAALPNSLISDGAIMVDNIDRPTEFYRQTQPEFFEKIQRAKSEQKIIAPGLTEEELEIVTFIEDCGGVAAFEALTEGCSQNPVLLSSKLMGLCIRGVVKQESGNRYALMMTDMGR